MSDKEIQKRIMEKVIAMRSLHELVCRKDRHAIPKAPPGFRWECVHYSGDQYRLSYLQLVDEATGERFPETEVMCEYPPHEDPEWEIPPPEHECSQEVRE